MVSEIRVETFPFVLLSCYLHSATPSVSLSYRLPYDRYEFHEAGNDTLITETALITRSAFQKAVHWG